MTSRDHGVLRARLVLGAVCVLIAGIFAAAAAGVYAVFSSSSSGTAGSARSAGPSSGEGPDASAAQPSPTGTGQVTMTPEKGEKVILDAPTGQKNGVSTGFPHTSKGAVSAAVHFWEEFAFVDDRKARQQLEAVVTSGSGQFVNEQISRVRTLREAAGLPPSGGTPAGITFSTSVNAACPRGLDDKGDVIQVWLNFDRYATKSDGGNDTAPFRNENTDLLLTWHKDAWRITDAAQYKAKRGFPAAYYPTSPHAWKDGWVQVRHGD